MGTSKKLVCVCQICNCGRHKCAHVPQRSATPSGPCTANSEYTEVYKRFDAHRPSAPVKPDAAYRPSKDPFDGSTTHKGDYVSHGSLPPLRMGAPNNYRPPSGTFDGVSSYKQDYFAKKPDQRIVTTNPYAASIKLGNGQMEGETTTGGDYTRKYVAPRQSAKPMGGRIQSDIPFDPSTTVKSDYTWHDSRPASSKRPALKSAASNLPFDGDTTHNMTYRPFEVQRMQQATGRQDGGVWRSPGEAFDHKTTVQLDYDRKKGAPAQSARPNYVRPAPGAFDDTTTYNSTTGRYQRPPSCQAKFLESREGTTSRNGYVYNSNRNGHQYFEQPVHETTVEISL